MTTADCFHLILFKLNIHMVYGMRNIDRAIVYIRTKLLRYCTGEEDWCIIQSNLFLRRRMLQHSAIAPSSRLEFYPLSSYPPHAIVKPFHLTKAKVAAVAVAVAAAVAVAVPPGETRRERGVEVEVQVLEDDVELENEELEEVQRWRSCRWR